MSTVSKYRLDSAASPGPRASTTAVVSAARPRASAAIADLALVAEIGATCRLAVRGAAEGTRSIARSIVVQLAANCGPADVRIVVVTTEPARWRWLEQLPHGTTATGRVAVVTESELLETVAQFDVAPHPHLVVITDAPHLLAARTSPLRRVVVADRSTALIVLVDADEGIPHVCTSLLDLSGPMNARWYADAALASLPVQARCAGISERSAARLVNCLSGLVDPEDPLGGAGRQSHATSRCCRCWRLTRRRPSLPRGWRRRGPVASHGDRCRCRRCGRHRSRSRRSARSDGRNHGRGQERAVAHVGRWAGGRVESGSPHVRVDRLQGRLDVRCLRASAARGRRRHRPRRPSRRTGLCEACMPSCGGANSCCAHVGAADLAAYRRSATGDVLPRLVVVIDEFAALVSEQPDFLHALVGIAQRGPQSRSASDPGDAATERRHQRRHPRQHQPAVGAAVA